MDGGHDSSFHPKPHPHRQPSPIRQPVKASAQPSIAHQWRRRHADQVERAQPHIRRQVGRIEQERHDLIGALFLSIDNLGHVHPRFAHELAQPHVAGDAPWLAAEHVGHGAVADGQETEAAMLRPVLQPHFLAPAIGPENVPRLAILFCPRTVGAGDDDVVGKGVPVGVGLRVELAQREARLADDGTGRDVQPLLVQRGQMRTGSGSCHR